MSLAAQARSQHLDLGAPTLEVLLREVGAQAWIVIIAILSSAVVLIVFAVDTFQNDKKAFWTMLALPVLAVLFDIAWKRRRTAQAPVA